MKKFLKKNITLKEDAERNYVADVNSSNESATEIVNKTKQNHSDANAVTFSSDDADGNANTNTSTIEVNNNPSEINNAVKMAKTSNKPSNIKVKLNNCKETKGNIIEGITFTKSELSKFLRSI